MAVGGYHLSPRQNCAVYPSKKNKGQPQDITILSELGILRRGFKMSAPPNLSVSYDKSEYIIQHSPQYRLHKLSAYGTGNESEYDYAPCHRDNEYAHG